MTPHHWVLHCESLKFGTCNDRTFVQAKPHASKNHVEELAKP